MVNCQRREELTFGDTPDGVAKDAYFEVHRTSKPVDIRRSQWSAVVDATDGTPRSYASSSSSSSDESEGPMTPRQRPVLGKFSGHFDPSGY